MARVHQQFKFNLMLLVGDNLYGSERPQDFQEKFEIPYKPLLDAGVEFRAALGNHDSREQRKYPKFDMNGEYYYSFKAPSESVRFIALESTYPKLEQIVWLEKQLKGSNEDWKIVYFHHSLYCSAGRHGSDVQLRDRLEPLFVAYNVSVVFTGHDHVYERTKPQKDIVYFVAGSGGKVAPGRSGPEQSHHRQGLRRRAGVPDCGDQQGRDDVQRGVAHRESHRLREDHPPPCQQAVAII